MLVGLLLFLVQLAVVNSQAAIRAWLPDEPDHLVRDLAFVTIQWAGVENPSDGDYIAIFNPPFRQPGSQLITWFFANSTGNPGYGLVDDFKLANMRQNSTNFVYFRASGNPLVASDPIDNEINYPTQGHLAVDSNNNLVVMWTSGSSEYPVVYYAPEGEPHTTIAGTTHTYTVDDLMPCAVNGTSVAIQLFRDPGFLHSVTLPDLDPTKRYSYKFGSVKHGISEAFTFSPPPLPRKDTATSIVFYGDQGTSLCADPAGYCSRGTSCVLGYLERQLDQNPSAYDMVFCVGDISYAVGIAYRWDLYMAEIQAIASRVPFMVSIGNHEYDYIGQDFAPSWGNYYNDSDGECAVPTRERFTMPWKEDTYWYSINYGNIHVVALSFEHNFLPGSDQYKWFVNDLKNVDRSVTPWVILVAHRPFYSSGISPDDAVIQVHIREALEPVIYHQVDLVLTGHYHNYERTCSVHQANCVKDGPVHVLIGTAGIEDEDSWTDPPPAWSQFRAAEFGHLEVHSNSTSLVVQYVGCRGGSVHDEITITKSFF